MNQIKEMIKLLGTSGINSKDLVIKMLKEMDQDQNLTLGEIIHDSHKIAKEKGWWDDPKSDGEILALFHSEVSEALEEVRKGKDPNEYYYSGKAKAKLEDGSLIGEMIVYSPTNDGKCILEKNSRFEPKEILIQKPEGIPSELADIIIRVADYCGYYDIDLDRAIREKLEYNRSRSYKHGGKVL